MQNIDDEKLRKRIEEAQMNIIDAARKAGQIANEQVPSFKALNTPEHDQWLAAWDKAFAQILLKEGMK